MRKRHISPRATRKREFDIAMRDYMAARKAVGKPVTTVQARRKLRTILGVSPYANIKHSQENERRAQALHVEVKRA